ncbi:hypothetical protein ACUR5C_04515 [Aliikangiella sp. IMCC44653]
MKVLITLVLLGLPFCSSAIEVNTSGFGSIIVTANDHKNFGYRNDISANDGVQKGEYSLKPHSNLGYQIDMTLAPQWDIVTQWIIRDQEEQNFDGFTRMALVRYIANNNWTLRAGRIPVNLFELSEVRDIGIAYSWASVPNEVYGLVPSRSQDGIDISYSTRANQWRYSAIFSYGQMEAEVTSESEEPIEFNRVLGLKLGAQSSDFNFSLRHSNAQVSKINQSTQGVVDIFDALAFIWPQAATIADQVDLRQHEFNYSSIYAAYYWDAFTLSGELASIDSTSLIVDNLLNGYLNLSYQYNDYSFYWLSAFTDAKRYRFEGDVPMLAPAQEAVLILEEINTFFRPNQVSHSIGLRWDIRPDLAFKAQIKSTQIDDAGNGLWQLDQGFRSFTPKARITTTSFGISFSF